MTTSPSNRGAWQPIETAPRESDEFGIGPRLLLYVPSGLDAPMVTIGCYFKEERRDESGRFLGGKWTAVDADMIRSAYVDPTHWMSLPAPPREEAADHTAALVEALRDAREACQASADILEAYIGFLHRMPSSELELHPYIPSVEDAFDRTSSSVTRIDTTLSQLDPEAGE